MENITLANLGRTVRRKRSSKGIREVSKEIGISTATLSRIENSRLPDLETFAKLCRWLKVDGGEILGCSQKKEIEPQPRGPVSVQIKTDKNYSPKVAKATTEMIIAALAYF